MKHSRDGYVTTELALLFPLCFVILLLLLQNGIDLTIRLYTVVSSEQAVMRVQERKKAGWGQDEAIGAGEEWMERQLGSLPGLSSSWEWGKENGFLEEAVSLDLTCSYRVVSESSWHQHIRRTWIDPVVFRNRVDLVVEIINDVAATKE